jgi:creatinine amidohydrolase
LVTPGESGNARGGNHAKLQHISTAEADVQRQPTTLVAWYHVSKSLEHQRNSHRRHARGREASILLAAHRNYLRDGRQSCDHTARGRRYLTTLGIGAYTTSGVIGPSRATAEKGQKDC